jgi:hypothetical protein
MSTTRANPPDAGFPISVPSCAQRDRVKVGRKQRDQSCANEIRARLAEWKCLPESSRPTLRALAQELGTSHQLLSHFLKNWASYWSKEYKRRAEEIRNRACQEHRELTYFEEQQADACMRAHHRWGFIETMRNGLNNLYADLQDGQLPTKRHLKAHLKLVDLAMSNDELRPICEKIRTLLAKTTQENLPKSKRARANPFRTKSGWVATPLKHRVARRRRTRTKLVFSMDS